LKKFSKKIFTNFHKKNSSRSDEAKVCSYVRFLSKHSLSAHNIFANKIIFYARLKIIFFLGKNGKKLP